ncbi:hypothetical protein TWF694_010618 [Orbilia ellipsospora]|uniref:Uncharacterized protein n=1 Tax=Orbilia ellipsospora TaxID=2528407 RepID=A0AAV9XAF7_9PEZI
MGKRLAVGNGQFRVSLTISVCFMPRATGFLAKLGVDDSDRIVTRREGERNPHRTTIRIKRKKRSFFVGSSRSEKSALFVDTVGEGKSKCGLSPETWEADITKRSVWAFLIMKPRL